MKIILQGTSSSGKSSIVNEFPNKFKKISMDNVLKLLSQTNDFNKKLENKFYTHNELDTLFFETLYEKIYNEAKLHKNYIIDLVYNLKFPEPKYFPDTEIYNILLYTNLSNLTDNINKRKNNDPVSKDVFEQYANYYKITKKKDSAIDTINIKSFINDLMKIKYEFTSLKDLKLFAKTIFEKIGIKDDKEYYITPRYKHYNLIINSTDKTPTELKNLIISKIN